MTLGTAAIVGVGPGLGLALARTFAHAGHPVAMFARDKVKLETYATELASSGQEVRGYATDAADPDNLRSALDTAFTELGAPDVLVYNTGVLRQDSPLGGDDQDWAHALAVNVLGARVAADAVLPVLREGRGSLLFTGGGLALSPHPQFASLSVGKAALRAYVQALHAQLAGTGVHATSVTIAGAIGGGEMRFDPAVLAQAYLDLHHEPENEWQHELLRD
jgi:NADP-dependent 3-hydroxy acid dehydrogenase YdfG